MELLQVKDTTHILRDFEDIKIRLLGSSHNFQVGRGVA